MNFINSRLAALILPTLALGATARKAKPAPIPPAPIPPAIAAAKTVFLANVCELPYAYCAPVYNYLYDAVGKQGKYQIVASPAEADLIFEIRYSYKLDSVSGVHGWTDSNTENVLQLKIVDRATQMPLWMITEPQTEKTNATEAVMLDLSVLSRPGETAGPIVKFPPKR